MIRANEESACREAVYNFCTKMNEWERIYSMISRIEFGKFVSETDRATVAGVTRQSHLEAHAELFAQYVVPKVRKYGSNPGQPNSWGNKGSFFDVSLTTIRSVSFRDDGYAEVITDWGYMLPGGQTMFVLKSKGDSWLVDSLKTRVGDEWKTAHV